jgi:hypothetical protein
MSINAPIIDAGLKSMHDWRDWGDADRAFGASMSAPNQRWRILFKIVLVIKPRPLSPSPVPVDHQPDEPISQSMTIGSQRCQERLDLGWR